MDVIGWVVVAFMYLGTAALFRAVFLDNAVSINIKKPWSGILSLLWPLLLALGIPALIVYAVIGGFSEVKLDKIESFLGRETTETDESSEEMVPKEALVWMIEVCQAWRPDDSYGPYDTEEFVELVLAQGEGYDDYGEKIEED